MKGPKFGVALRQFESTDNLLCDHSVMRSLLVQVSECTHRVLGGLVVFRMSWTHR